MSAIAKNIAKKEQRECWGKGAILIRMGWEALTEEVKGLCCLLRVKNRLKGLWRRGHSLGGDWEDGFAIDCGGKGGRKLGAELRTC